MNSVDLHFHLLPGVDGGPAVGEDSVALAATAARELRLASGLHAAQVDALTGGAPRRLLSHGIDPAPTLVA